MISDFARTNPALTLKGGLLQGRILDGDRTRALADLESREVLLAKVVGVAQMPLVQVLGVTQAILRKTAALVAALQSQRQPDNPTPETPQPAETPETPEPTETPEPAETPEPTETSDSAETPEE